MKGSCNCQAVTVEITDPKYEAEGSVHGHVCHCSNCQKTSGSALGATNLLLPAASVNISDPKGMLSVYEDPASKSGNIVKRFFCKTCGSPVKSETKPATENGMVILKTGVFGRQVPKPELETFVDNRWQYAQKQQGATQFKLAKGGEKLDE